MVGVNGAQQVLALDDDQDPLPTHDGTNVVNGEYIARADNREGQRVADRGDRENLVPTANRSGDKGTRDAVGGVLRQFDEGEIVLGALGRGEVDCGTGAILDQLLDRLFVAVHTGFREIRQTGFRGLREALFSGCHANTGRPARTRRMRCNSSVGFFRSSALISSTYQPSASRREIRVMSLRYCSGYR